MPVSAERDHIRGCTDAPITLLEYGDYEWPHCAAAHPIVSTILEQVGGAVRFVYRHFPLTTIHPHAEAAAEAAQAARAATGKCMTRCMPTNRILAHLIHRGCGDECVLTCL